MKISVLVIQPVAFSFPLDCKPVELCLCPGKALVVMFLLQFCSVESTGF